MTENPKKTRIYLEEEKPIIEFPELIQIIIIFIAFCMGLSLIFLPWYMVLILFLGFCLCVAIFFNLFIGILVFLLGAFFHPTFWLASLQSLHPARNLALGVMFIWGFHTIVYKDFKMVKAPQGFFIVAFFLLAFATTFKAFDMSFPYFFEFSVKSLVLYFAISNLVKKRDQVIFLIWFMCGIGLISALIGFYQYVFKIGLYYAPEGIFRIRGLAEDANVYAMDLVFTLPLAIGLFFYYRSTIVKAITAGIIFLLIVGTILSFSRAGLVQLMSVLFFSLGIRIFKRRKFLGVLAFIAAVIIFLPLVPVKYWERAMTITKFSDPAIDIRLVGWRVGLNLMKDNFFTGVGFGMFRSRFFEIAIMSKDIPYKMGLDAHNLFIHTGAEMGIGGLILLLILLFLTLKYLREAKKNFKEKNDVFLFEISSAIETSVFVFLIGGIFISYLQLLIFWIMVPLAVVLKSLSKQAE